MEMISCPNCNKLTGYRRALGFGTFFAVLLTAGLWLLTIPFYPKRCITCGLRKSDSVPWYRTWRMAFVLVLGVAVLAAAIYKFSTPRASTPSAMALLGFQPEMKDAGVHATTIGFRLNGCEDKGDDFRYCNYFRQQDESLRLILWRGELQTAEYSFGIRRFDSVRKELSAYGAPWAIYQQYDPTAKVSDNWGSLSKGASLSLIEYADHTGGVATLNVAGGKFEQYMKSSYPVPPKLPEMPAQTLPEVQKAERRLFGERTTEVDGLEVTSETLQGTLAVTTRCKAHFCSDHYAMWTVDLTTGEAAGVLADESTVLVCLGDDGSPEKLPQVLQSEIEEQSKEGVPSPKRVLYVPQAQ